MKRCTFFGATLGVVIMTFVAGIGTAVAAPKSCPRTVTVTDPGDDGSPGQLRTALAQVCNGGTVLIDPSITEPMYPWRFTIDKNVKLLGSGQTLVGSGFDVTSTGTLVVSGLTLMYSIGLPAFDVDGVLAAKDVTVTASLNAIVANPGSRVVLSQGTLLTGNVSDRREGGAAIYIDGGSVTLTDYATVTDNLNWGCYMAPGIPPMGFGGGIYIQNGGSLTLMGHAVVSNNKVRFCDPTKGDGGAGWGGGVCSRFGTITLSDYAQVTGNIAGIGGGISAWYSTVTMNDHATISGNEPTGAGGGIHLYLGSTLTMNGASSIADNTSGGNGGGVAVVSSVMTMNDAASVTGNTVGGVYLAYLSAAYPRPRLVVNDEAVITGNSPYDVYPTNTEAPVAMDDGYSFDSTGGATVLTVGAAEGVLANDTDADTSHAWLTAVLVSGPSHGTLDGGDLGSDGSFAYTPEPGFSGVDTFTYKALDQSFESNTATVQIIVDAFCNGHLATLVGSGTITGTSGDDVIVGSDGPDVIDGLDGNDTICALDGDDTLTGGLGADWLDGGAGTDTLVESGADFTLTDTALDRRKTGGETSSDEIVGIEQAHLTGTSLNDILNASAFHGPVTLDGLAGVDTLTGGPGDDTLMGGPGADNIAGGAGIDTVVESRDANMTLTNTRLIIGAEGNDLLSGIEVAILTGGPGPNTLSAVAFTGQVTLDGDGGNDVLTGSSGDDTLYGGEGDDTLDGRAGDDTLDGGPGSDTCIPSTGTDTIVDCEL